MSDQETKLDEVESIEATELEDVELDSVAGGLQDVEGTTINNQCTNTGC